VVSQGVSSLNPPRRIGCTRLTNPSTDPDSPRLKKMVQASYEESEMPDDYDDVKKSFGSKFGNAGIYIRKANASSRL
jgi:hypothetical protein